MFKMIVLLCSLAATPDLNDCNEKTAIGATEIGGRYAPYAARCEHDSQHEQAQLLYRDQITVMAAAEHGGPPYDAADRKIKVLCIPME